MPDLLAGADWWCARTFPDVDVAPGSHSLDGLQWLPAQVPGTAADALRTRGDTDYVRHDYDAEDWWFRCRFRGQPGSWTLRLEGLATLGDVWLNNVHIAQTENMFVRSSVTLTDLQHDNELTIKCSSLSSLRAARQPRPRWKTAQVEHQGLRWIRSTLLGRIPGWAGTPRVVGPWRPVTITESDPLTAAEVHLQSRCVGTGGLVEATVTLPGTIGDEIPRLYCHDEHVPFEINREAGFTVLRASIALDAVERWWPHTHGSQKTYAVELRVGQRAFPLGRVGFKTLEVDQSDGGFTFVVNEEPIFVRGANWFPPDSVRFAADESEVVRRLRLARDGNLNMIRIPGTTAYVDQVVLDTCDELGILVWSDCMFAYMDYPNDESFLDLTRQEIRQAFLDLAPHPCLAVVCGNQEVEEIAAMSGVAASAFESELFDKLIPSLAAEIVPEAVFVTSNPSGGEPSYRPDTGVSQYFGVGGYLRSLQQLRGDAVRFAAECMCFATPPEPDAIDRFGGASLAVHDPRWKASIHQDAGRSWDMDDLRAYYTREVFGVDAFSERYMDPERSLDLGRATNATLIESVFSEWRCNQQISGGGLVLGFNDVALGAGWGLIDVEGSPKAPWYTFRRASATQCIRFRDEGLNGLYAHIFNEADVPLTGTVEINLYSNGEILADHASVTVELSRRASTRINVTGLFTGFYDLNYAYRFGPPKYDVVVGRLVVDDEQRSEDVFLPLGHGRAREADVGLRAHWVLVDDQPILRVSTRRFAQWVSINAAGFRPADSWFHLAPGSERSIALLDGDPARPPRGRVRSINSATDAVIRPMAEDQ